MLLHDEILSEDKLSKVMRDRYAYMYTMQLEGLRTDEQRSSVMLAFYEVRQAFCGVEFDPDKVEREVREERRKDAG